MVVKGQVTKVIMNEISKIFEHINDISHENLDVSRMILYIKEDYKGKLWFLFSQSLRLTKKV